jgi:hypothetical protein
MTSSVETIGLFLLAIFVLLLAQAVRSARHSFLFPSGAIGRRFGLLLALSLSSAISSIFPLHVGEVVRALFVAVRYNLHFSYVAATIVAERLSDLVAVALISLALSAVFLPARGLFLDMMFVLAGLSCALLLFAFAVIRLPAVRRAIWSVASIFNDRIKLGIVDFAWSFAQLAVGGELVSRRYLACSLGMWALYLAAYGLFAGATGTALDEVTFALLGAPHRSLIEQALSQDFGSYGFALLVFTSVPVLAVVLYGALRQRRQIAHSFTTLLRESGFGPAGSIRPTVRTRFRSVEGYSDFLRSHFAARNLVVSDFGMTDFDDAVVHRFFVGGSDAITALVEVSGKLVIRKFAMEAPDGRLKEQADWLRNYSQELSLADVLSDQSGRGNYSYDMPYLISARDFYEVIHTSEIGASKRLLNDIVNRVAAFHESNALGHAPSSAVAAYLEEKVKANAEKIVSFVSSMLPARTYTINNERYDLADWDTLRDMTWLRNQIRSVDVGVIHGDLTIENIIVCSERQEGWYIIDPNPRNVFDTPLIDWAKLMQSLNLGYESLNRGGHSMIQDDMIRIGFTRSSAYSELYASFVKTLKCRFDPERLNEIAFHELVHYLRLTPYKIRQNPQKGLTFFACTSILLRRYLEGRALREA